MKSESGINWVILDVDGVMTDGKLYFTSQGEEIKVFSVYDGLALNNLRNAGKRICVISGRGSDALRNRLNEFSISEMHLNRPDKGAVMEELYTKYGNEIYNAAAIGDDLPDLAVFKLVKYSFAVNNAVPELKHVATHQLKKFGGDGAVREMVDYILKNKM